MNITSYILKIITKKARHLVIWILGVSLLEAISVILIASILGYMEAPQNDSNPIVFLLKNFDIRYPYLVGLIAFFLFIIYVLSSITTYLINRDATKIGFDLSNDILEKYINDIQLIKSQNTFDFISKIYTESIRFSTNVLVQSIHLASKILLSLLIFIILLYYNPKGTLVIILILCPTALIYIRVTRKKLKLNSKAITSLNSNRLKILKETIEGIEYLKTYGMTTSTFLNFKNSSNDYSNRHSYNQTVQSLPKYLLEAIVIFSLLIYSIVFYSENNSSKGFEDIFLLGAAGLKLLPNINIIINSLSKVQANLDAARVIEKDLKFDDLENISNSDKLKINKISKIEIRNGVFSFTNSHNLFENLNFLFEKGKWYHITGRSGKGKTTLLRILLNIYQLNKGEILYNNKELSRIEEESFYSQIGFVSQKIYLFDESLDFNICLSEEIDIKKLECVKRICNINYSNPVTELSGGQIQRIGIARALYKNPSVLILDEAFVGLDRVSEEHIREQIEPLLSHMIVIEINHSKFSVRELNRVQI
jgi:ABC-type bacteriocin/lantibiotic exporter with double-glycine peptidase domain